MHFFSPWTSYKNENGTGQIEFALLRRLVPIASNRQICLHINKAGKTWPTNNSLNRDNTNHQSVLDTIGATVFFIHAHFVRHFAHESKQWNINMWASFWVHKSIIKFIYICHFPRCWWENKIFPLGKLQMLINAVKSWHTHSCALSQTPIRPFLPSPSHIHSHTVDYIVVWLWRDQYRTHSYRQKRMVEFSTNLVSSAGNFFCLQSFLGWSLCRSHLEQEPPNLCLSPYNQDRDTLQQSLDTFQQTYGNHLETNTSS